MNEKDIKHFWPFEYYDYDLINAYINNKAKQGEALEYIGTHFATFKETTPGEYEYLVDFRDDICNGTEAYDNYIKQWEKNGFLHVCYREGIRIFRCKKSVEESNKNRCLNLDSFEIRENIYKKVRKKCLIEIGIQIILLMVSIFLYLLSPVISLRILLIALIVLQLAWYSKILSFISLRERRKNNYIFYHDKSEVEKNIEKLFKLQMIKNVLMCASIIVLLIVPIIVSKDMLNFCLVNGFTGCIIIAYIYDSNKQR